MEEGLLPSHTAPCKLAHSSHAVLRRDTALQASCLLEHVCRGDGALWMRRSIAVHPTMPYLLSSSDDMLIKLWDWEKGWACTQIFEGHSHYVMQARLLSNSAC